jgi:hypothetical protein
MIRTAPKVESRRHIEAGQTDNDNGCPRLPDEAVLDRFESFTSVGAKITTANRRQHNGGRHRHTADPYHHGEDM